MIERYGQPWVSVHGLTPSAIGEAEWGDAIADLSDDEIRGGFTADLDRGKDFPPSSARFRAMARPRSDAPRTYLGGAAHDPCWPAIESDAARRAAAQALTEMAQRLGVPVPDLKP